MSEALAHLKVPPRTPTRIEYKVLMLSLTRDLEKSLNHWAGFGWTLHSITRNNAVMYRYVEVTE